MPNYKERQLKYFAPSNNNMSNHISVHEYPIFKKGIFKNHPALFEPYFINTPDHQKKKYQKAKKNLPNYEEQYSWQIINGPGFCGTTHPGTGKIFHKVMTNSIHPVSNSDCLYVNPAQNVFAISDPPSVTTFSRDLITKLDERLKSDSPKNLENMINEINQNAGNGSREKATLALVHLPQSVSDKAFVLLGGDSYLFQGNRIKREISGIEADVNRWGTSNTHFELKQIDIVEGDFFVLASDGITSLRPNNEKIKLDHTILNLAMDDPDNFALNATLNCNDIITQETAGRTRTIFGCIDNLSILLVDPAKLQPIDFRESYILGGYVE